jgi:hypothetical protein
MVNRVASGDQTLAELFQRYCKKAEIVHYFAENLAQPLGVFHGVNETGQKLAVEGEVAMALSTSQRNTCRRNSSSRVKID